jgi:hypothetical protein
MSKAKLSIKEIDQRLPELAKTATRNAYRRALKAGSVLVYRNGELRRVEAGGKSTMVKQLEPRVPIKKGTKFEIKAD